MSALTSVCIISYSKIDININSLCINNNLLPDNYLTLLSSSCIGLIFSNLSFMYVHICPSSQVSGLLHS